MKFIGPWAVFMTQNAVWIKNMNVEQYGLKNTVKMLYVA